MRARRRAARSRSSPSRLRCARREWHATIAAWSAYGPERRSGRVGGAARAPEGVETALDEEPVPQRAILVEEEDRLALRADAGPGAGGVQLHQRDEPVDLRLARGEAGQDPPEAQRVLAEGGAHPVVARRRRVPLVEDQVDDLEDRRQPRPELVPVRDLERDPFVGQRPLRPDDPLRDRRLREEERPRDLLRRQAAEQAQGERHAGVGREHRMAGGEDEPEQLVPDVVVDRGLDRSRRVLARSVELEPELAVLALEHRAAAEGVQGAVPRRRHQPGARASGTPDFGHCSSAATSASCASSSASATSRTIRARPAMSLGDSIR